MLVEDLQKAWRRHAIITPIEPVMCFKTQGLVLGADTVLAPAAYNAPSSAIDLQGEAPRLLTLLSTAYGRLIDEGALRHIVRATHQWRAGDNGLAAVHLALTRLHRLNEPQEAARRLFFADALLSAGAEPDMLFSAMDLKPPTWSRVAKFYNPAQPRIPAGSGRASGQWAKLGRFLLQNLSREDAVRLGLLAARFTAPAVFFGVLFLPTNKTSVEEEQDVPGHPGIRIGRQPGDRFWRVIYKDDQGDDQQILQRSDGTLRDPEGHIVGRVLTNGHVAIDMAAVAPKSLDNNEPRYCPAPTKDNPGRGPGSIPREYEDQVKRFVNPEAPTPSGMAVELANPMNNGKNVKFDDCEHSTGTMIEAKGPTLTKVILAANNSNSPWSVDDKLLDQGERQVQAAGSRHIRWYFADKAAADHTRELFAKAKNGQARIEIDVFPYVGPRK